MKLYIAEKPSLGKAIAAALPKPHHSAEGCIYVGHSDKKRCDVVSWCIGHLLEQAEPDAYDEALKKWSHETLPILPDHMPQGWQLLPKKQTRKQFNILKKLVKRADQIVHCGDPDREGQLLVDELIHYVGISDTVKSVIERCLVSDLNLPAVKKSLQSLRPNKEFSALSVSALARSRADWLYGMNLTRAYTIQAQKVGFGGVVSVGRVQTPVLGLVVKRDLEIDAFVPRDYYEVMAHLSVDGADTDTVAAKWQPSEACERYQDDEGHVLSRALAENVVQRIEGQEALVEKVMREQKKQAAPLPLNLSTLQIEAAKRYGFSAKVVLDVCQALYERHKLITYPRSDNRYLPQGHFSQAAEVCRAIANNSSLSSACEGADLSVKGRAWNDTKVAAHHAIIPTHNSRKQGALSHAEQQVYELIARYYLCQFYPAWQYQDQQIDFRIAGGVFIAKQRVTTRLAWKALLQAENARKETPPLPDLKERQILHCQRGELLSKQTQAPKYFTDASLLAAMTGIARYVADAEVKKILKETDGLGTDATRASIIELLFRRQFLRREGKTIRATQAGKQVIASLPDCVALPDMTAQWESRLNQISQECFSYSEFMAGLESRVKDLLQQSKSCVPTGLANIKGPGKAKRRTYKSAKKNTKTKGRVKSPTKKRATT